MSNPGQPDPPSPGGSKARPISDELRPYVNRDDAPLVDAAAERLREGRAVPRPAFRSELKARLVDLDRSASTGWRPKRLKATVAAYGASGLVLMVIAAAGVAGTGPLGF